MNVKNLFLLLLLLAGFASCSSNGNDEIPETEKASLTLKLETQGGYGTRAADDAIAAWESESKVNSYVILLFRSDSPTNPSVFSGKEATSQIVNNLPAGVSIKAYAFVNLSDKLIANLKLVTKEENLKDFTEELAIQGTDKLTMASTVPATITLKTGNNYLDIDITRLVSRIQISSINTKFSIANDHSVRIDKLELANAKSSSLLYTNGAAEVKDAKWAPVFEMTNQLATTKNEVLSNKSPKVFNKKSDDADGQKTVPYGYVFENTDEKAPTQLILTATLLDKDDKEVSTQKFTVTVNSAGTSGVNPHKYVKRNYIYDLGLTFNDESFKMAALVVKVTVVPWGKVHQVSEVD
mgnify:CR=1 FL=1